MTVYLLDSRDSNTYNLVHGYEELGVAVVVEPSHQRDADEVRRRMNELGAGLLVVGPGPRAPSDIPGLLPLVKELTGHVPIFGVCLGLQALVLAHGGRIGHARRPMHGKTSAISHGGSGLFAGIPSPFLAMRYHSLITTDTEFTVTAMCDGEIMAIEGPLFSAVQFHPESICTQSGLQILYNSLLMAGLSARKPRYRFGGIPPPPRAGYGV